MSTATIISQKTITVETGSTTIKSKGVRVAGSNGSTTPKTEKGLLTGIRELRRNLTKELHHKPSSHARHTADAPNRGGRISPGAELTSSKEARLQGGVMFRARKAVPSQVWTAEAARRVITATGAVPAGRACPVAVEVVVPAVVAAVEVVVPAVVAAVVAAAAAAEGGRHVKI
jgi:hypothetical protein